MLRGAPPGNYSGIRSTNGFSLEPRALIDYPWRDAGFHRCRVLFHRIEALRQGFRIFAAGAIAGVASERRAYGGSVHADRIRVSVDPADPRLLSTITGKNANVCARRALAVAACRN